MHVTHTHVMYSYLKKKLSNLEICNKQIVAEDSLYCKIC